MSEDKTVYKIPKPFLSRLAIELIRREHPDITIKQLEIIGYYFKDLQEQLLYTIEKESHWDKTQINKMV